MLGVSDGVVYAATVDGLLSVLDEVFTRWKHVGMLVAAYKQA